MTNGNVFQFKPDWQGKGLAVASVQFPLVGTEIVIPDCHDGKPVTEIQRLFSSDDPEARKLLRVVIPDSVVRLDDWAFAGCENLADVKISNNSSLGTIAQYAFYNCKSIRNINLPETLRSIGDSAFSGCATLESFHFVERIILLGNSAFYNCSNLRTVTFDPDCNLPDIKYDAFYGCASLQRVSFHRDLVNIFDNAFCHCSSLQSVQFPMESELYSIDSNAFGACPMLTELSIKNCTKLFSIGQFAFYNSSKLASVEFPIGHTVKLYDNAFPKSTKKINYKSQGCYVATCVYGSYDCAPVWTLRRFRDDKLSKSAFGRTFIKLYYAVSPTAVKWFGKTKWFNNLLRPVLNTFVKRLKTKGYLDTPYED